MAFWAVGAHNRLTRLRAQVFSAFAFLDTTLTLWLELVPPSPDLGQLSEEALADEAGWSTLRAAAIQLAACQAVARQRRLRRADIAALSAARDVLRDAWQRLLVDMPRFGGQPQAGSIHLVWEQRDTQVQLATDRYNQAVLLYNSALGQFPAVVLAWLLRLRRAQVL